MRRTIFGDEHDAFRESVRGFLLKEAAPHGERWERAGMVDRSFWTKAAQQGLVGFQAPAALGGAGIDDFRFNAVIDEEVAYGGIVGDNFMMQNDIAAPYLLELTTPEQRERWVPGFTAGDLVCAIAMSEPGAGSDLRGIAASAKRDGAGGYRLSGSKTFVTSGIQADLVVVAARLDDERRGMCLFVVESGADGFTRGRRLAKVGRKAQDTAELFFEDVRVEPEDRLGHEGEGMRLLIGNLPQERLAMAVTAVAASEKALEITLAYVRERFAFGQPVGSFQANRFLLADLTTEVAVARVYVDRCLEAHVAGELTAAEAAAAKYWTTEQQFRVLDACVQLHGGYGYMEEYAIARMWRDARVQRIYGGTTEIMKEIVSRELDLGAERLSHPRA
jgi:alkylation response protein AidB-like acyl-CoA dehydrogenase